MFNENKFEIPQKGKHQELKDCTSYTGPNNNQINESNHVKDLGIQIWCPVTLGDLQKIESIF